MLFLIKTEVSIGYVVALKKEFLLRVKANAIDGAAPVRSRVLPAGYS